MPEADWGRHNRWLTTLTIDAHQFGCDTNTVRMAMEAENIEARPVWKPMHLQPIFEKYETIGGEVAESLFENGLCLPSGTAMIASDLERVVTVMQQMHRQDRRVLALS